ncbi:MAG: hypothetical protein AAFY56_12970, partial [Pseudomonadota bacterium]
MLKAHWLAAFLWLALTWVADGALAQTTAEIRPARPNETVCPTPLLQHASGSWTPQEIWTWNQRLCLGLVADLSEYRPELGGACDPSEAEYWPSTRVLSPAFVQLVLFYEPFRSVFNRRGFRVRCARFADTLDLSDGEFARAIKLERSYFAQGIEATNLRLAQDFSLEGSRLAGPLRAASMAVEGSIEIGNGTRFEQDVDLSGSVLGGNLVASSGSTFAGELNLYGVRVG